MQHLRFQPPKNRELLASAFGKADLILSVSQFNTRQLIEAFPWCEDRVAQVPNAAEDLFFEPASRARARAVRADLGLPAGLPYLLSVANFQPRKNLVRLIRAVRGLPEVAAGDLGLVLLGTGAEDEARPLREAIATAGRRAIIRMPGYRQGKILRAAYAEATALVFPSLCESFGIPVVEAMAQGIPAALADSTALPEIGGDAGWYFDPESQDAITATLRELARSSRRVRAVASPWAIHRRSLSLADCQRPAREGAPELPSISLTGLDHQPCLVLATSCCDPSDMRR